MRRFFTVLLIFACLPFLLPLAFVICWLIAREDRTLERDYD